MSILAKLLKKNSNPQDGGEVLPGLQRAVSSTGTSPDRRRRTYLLIAAGAVAAIVGGGLLTVYLQTRTPAPQIVGRPPAVQASAPQAQLQSSSARVDVVPPPPVETVAVVASPRHVVNTAIKKTPGRLTASAGKKTAVKASGTVHPKEQKAVVKDRATIDAWLFAARTAEAHHDYNQAMDKYKKVLESDPFNYRVMNNVASMCLRLGLNNDALSYANQALKLKGDYVSALVNGGIAQGKLGNDNGAKSMLIQAITVEPANRQALYNMGLLQERSSALDDSYATWRRLADAGDADGLLGMARIKERRSDKDEALRLYRDLLTYPEANQRQKDVARERIGVLDR